MKRRLAASTAPITAPISSARSRRPYSVTAEHRIRAAGRVSTRSAAQTLPRVGKAASRPYRRLAGMVGGQENPSRPGGGRAILRGGSGSRCDVSIGCSFDPPLKS